MACWLYIVGAADSLDYARCERIGEIMQLSLPSARIETRAILPNEWPSFLGDKCAEFGLNPHATTTTLSQEKCIVWNRSGKLVGHSRSFEDFARTRYQITCDLDIEGLQRNAKANLLLTLQAKQQLQLRLKRRTRRAVVVVDMQIDFSGTGRLGTGAAFDGMVPIVNCVLNNHEWTSVVFLQLMRQYSDFERELRREAAQYRENLKEQERQRLQTAASHQPGAGAGAVNKRVSVLAGSSGNGLTKPSRRASRIGTPGAGRRGSLLAAAGGAGRRGSLLAGAGAGAGAGGAGRRGSTLAAGVTGVVGQDARDPGLALLRFHPHCIEGESGSRIHPYLVQKSSSAGVTITHRHHSDFGPLLDQMLPVWQDAGVEEVFLCGMSLDGSMPMLAREIRERSQKAATGGDGGEPIRVLLVSNACCEIASKRHVTAATPHYRVINTNEIPLASTPVSDEQ